MTTYSTILSKNEQRHDLKDWFTGFALLAGFFLSIFSWLDLCVQHCSVNQHYRLFGFPFAFIGILFFLTLLNLLFFSKYYPTLKTFVGWMLALALGSEVMFIGVQKYQIGHWCPVCLGIALSLALATLAFSWFHIKNFVSGLFNHNLGDIMKTIKSLFKHIPFFLAGFLLAFAGISKIDAAQIAANNFKDRIALGQKDSPIEIYFISDWFCSSCKKVEPRVEKLLPKIQNKVAFYFIDYAVHTKSSNFAPYNLAFLINDKHNYFLARNALLTLADTNDSPKDEDIQKLADKYKLTFKELPYLDVKTGLDYFDKIATKYDLESTPTLVVVNVKTQKFKKLEGSGDITEANILKAIDNLSK